MKLQDSVIAITGGGQGLGRADHGVGAEAERIHRDQPPPSESSEVAS